MARNDRWKLIVSGTNETYLFDQRDDPHELNNSIDDPKHADLARELRSELRQWMESIGDRSVSGR